MLELLKNLARLLREAGDDSLAVAVEYVISRPETEINPFLVSNDLWGGAGSIADEGGLKNGKRNDATRRIQHSLIELGNEQIRRGMTNPRTGMWVKVFQKWEDNGI